VTWFFVLNCNKWIRSDYFSSFVSCCATYKIIINMPVMKYGNLMFYLHIVLLFFDYNSIVHVFFCRAFYVTFNRFNELSFSTWFDYFSILLSYKYHPIEGHFSTVIGEVL
jgi:hypothetical protein